MLVMLALLNKATKGSFSPMEAYNDLASITHFPTTNITNSE